MPFVVDASIVIAWALQDEQNEFADCLLDRARHEGAVAPALLWYEIRNALAVAERRNRISPVDSDQFLRELERLPMQTATANDSPNTMRLARIYKLSVYDAAYLDVAVRANLPLATTDERLAAAARKEGLAVLAD